ncbi:MAG: winged helix-turn-helix domain-containing protein, partial [Gammaproteobacteria bacterium]|nr:winged helix-turn-helix domain-containing protein [Gammaproteobacteria bacterium]
MASWHEDFVLGDWLVSPKLNRISKNGQAVSIKHKSMLVLVALADAKGEVLTRNEIMDSVWPGMEVTDDVLTQSVVELRKAFNDEARQPRYIETIPRVGFRLLPMVAQPATTSKAPNPRYALVAVVAIAIGSLTWLGIDRLSSERNPVITTQDPIAIAVLPFVNMSDDPANEYFSDSMSEELANVLVRIPSLRVTSRTSTFSYRGSDKKLTVIGDELGVTYIIEGSVRKTGSRIKVAVKLVEVESDT